MEKVIASWVKKGFINQETGVKLLNDANIEKNKRNRLIQEVFIYAIAAIFIAICIERVIDAKVLIAFWKKYPFCRICSSVLWGIISLLVGLKAYKKDFPRLGDSLLLISALLVVTSYGIIGGICHISIDMCLWFSLFTILPMAYIFKNNLVNFLSIMLFLFCSYYYHDYFGNYDVPWIIGGALLYLIGNIKCISDYCENFSLSYKLCGIFVMNGAFLFLVVNSSSVQLNVHLIFAEIILLTLCIVNFFRLKDKLQKTETMIVGASLIVLLLIATSYHNIWIINMLCFATLLVESYRSELLARLMNCGLALMYIVRLIIMGRTIEIVLFFGAIGAFLLFFGVYLEKRRNRMNKLQNAGIQKDEAQKMKEKLEAAGAKVELK